VFVIAQRISTVRDADLILVLDDGGIAAQGRHEDLLRDSELYNQILGSQLRDDSVGAATSASEHPLRPVPSEASA
jgi:ATP-binding cassette subfamily B multidrug efflux pump